MAGNTVAGVENSLARRLVVLGLLLQALHVLFGITAIMGMFINHMLVEKSKDTLYYSHIRWQLMTFWVSAALYALAFYAWLQLGLLWPAVLVLLFTIYRIGIGIYYFITDQPIERLI